MNIPIEEDICDAKIAYPSNPSANVKICENKLVVTATETNTAVFIEVETKH